MRILGVNVEYLGFAKRFSPMILSVMAVALLCGGMPAFLENFSAAPVPASMKNLKKTGPYKLVKIESPRRNGFLFEDQSQEKRYFVGWEELGAFNYQSSSTGYLWLYAENKFRKIWCVEVDGAPVLALDVAKRIYASELKMEGCLWKMGWVLVALFFLSIFKIGKLDMRGFFN